MALLKFKRSAVPAKVPALNDLALGELAINTYDGKVYTKKDDGTPAIVEIGGTASTTSTLLMPVRNNTGATLTKGTAVYINGALGQNSTVAKAIATSDATSAQTLGIITADLPNNTVGNVTLIGTITNINTSAYTDGQQLYLSPTTAGTLTPTKPYAPNHLVYMAVVEHAHPTQGKLFVKVQNGYEMDELHDVSAQNPANNDGLFYNTTSGLWEKKSIPTALGYTPVNRAGDTMTGQLSITGMGNVNGGNLQLGDKAEGTNKWSVMTGGHYNGVSQAKGVMLIGSYSNSTANQVSIGGNVWEANPATQIVFYTSTTTTHATGGTSRLSINGSGNVVAEVDIRAPIFYDSPDSSFYFDGAGATNLNNLYGNGKLILTSGDSYLRINEQNAFSNGVWYGPSNIGVNGVVHLGSNGTESTARVRIVGGSYNGSNVILVDGSNGRISAAEMRAPIFYDTPNTAFYVDPSETSNLNFLNVSGSSVYRSDWTTRFQSPSDFVDGTLVTTDIPATGWAGDSFVIEITGKSYDQNNPPFKVIAQGYLYNDTIINYSGISYAGNFASYIKVFQDGGVLKFWWPRISYWNSFNVNVMSMDGQTNGTITRNRVTAIGNSTEPTGTKKQQINLTKTLKTGDAAGSISGFNNPTTAPTANTIVYRDAIGDIAAREIILSSGLSTVTPTVLVSMYPTTNQMVRTTPAAVAASLQSSIQSAASGTWGINITGNSVTSNGLGTRYDGGQRLNPQDYFGQGIGLRVAMTAVAGVWSDTLWINGYAGGDVLNMCALHTSRQATPRMWISSQASNGTSYGTLYELPTLGYNSGNTAGLYAGIYYDSNNTACFVDPTSTSVLSTVRADRLQFSSGNEAVTLNNGSYLMLRDPTANIALYLGGADPANYYDNNTHWFRTRGASNIAIINSGGIQAPVFYDINDTGYYLDPNTTGLALRVNGNIECYARSAAWSEGYRVRVPTRGTWGGIRFTRDEGNSNGNWAIGFTGVDTTDDLTFWSNSGGAEGMRARLTQGGIFSTSGELRTSGQITNSNYMVGGSQSGAVNIGRNDLNYRWEGTAWGSTTTLGLLANCADYWEMGIHDSGSKVISPLYYDGGGRFLMGRDIGWGQTYVEAASSFRAPVFYDSNNTGYYLDPNGSSNVYDMTIANTIYCYQWFRSYGDSGWFNQSYGGGIFMQDATWVRVYNGKALYVPNEIAATGNITAYYSDERLKTKTGGIDNALEKVVGLNGFLYVENDLARSLGYTNAKQQVGVSAQAVQAVLPEAVSLAPVDFETLEDGTITSKSGENYLTVDYSRLVPLLIEAIKELSLKVKTLEEKDNSI